MVSLKLIRRVVQVAVFVLFLVLLVQTVSPVESWLPPDFFLRLDPLAGVSSMLASRSAGDFFPRFAPAVLVIALTAARRSLS